uniref:Alpha-galactosidase n=1 Tax=Heterorhabditis bacteriophora TaxID=37862 RepID=A0A1I7X7P4_HETBA
MIDHPDMVNYHLIAEHCNLWRNFDDINSSWKSIMTIVNYYDHNQDRHIPTHGPGQWHDPDMDLVNVMSVINTY